MSARRALARAAPYALGLALAGGASGFWQASGSGSGQAGAQAGPAPVTIAGATPGQLLLPTGAASGDVAATITNPNPYRVHINAVALDNAAGSGGFSANAAGCALSFTTQTNGGAGWTVPAGASLAVGLANSLTMGTAAASACQNRTFTVYLEAS